MQNAKPLIESVERLYKVFSRYPLHKHVEGCPCCVHETDKRALEAKPLRQLTSSDLGRYAFKAMTTWGDKDDFRHFLPRIFELLVSEKGMGWDEEVILGKLALAEWSERSAPTVEIPKGFRLSAQGCEERATLGNRGKQITTLKELWPGASPVKRRHNPRWGCGDGLI
jgi:hypothetical protein